ncbi:hypothetical protein HDE_12872 [Halotydeus destructor]|nr:hypothetical protein HDE_12872 [Halotydeus destructor]
MKVLIFLTLLLVVNAAQKKEDKSRRLPLTWEDCGDNDARTDFSTFTLEPQPVTMTRLSRYTANIEGHIKEDVPAGAILHLRVERLQNVLGRTVRIPIPCMKKVFGTCTLNFCEYLNHPQVNKAACTLIEAAGHKCECPMKAGVYKMDDLPLVFNLAKIKLHPLLQKFGSGNYRISARIADEKKKTFACVAVQTWVQISLEDFDDFQKQIEEDEEMRRLLEENPVIDD